MKLVFPYESVPLRGPPPPTLLPGATRRTRPMAPIRVINPVNSQVYPVNRAVLDTGADDSVLPMTVARGIGLTFLPVSGTGFDVRWRGALWPMQYADVLLQFDDGVHSATWPACIAFS